jgi:hypothetical protein
VLLFLFSYPSSVHTQTKEKKNLNWKKRHTSIINTFFFIQLIQMKTEKVLQHSFLTNRCQRDLWKRHGIHKSTVRGKRLINKNDFFSKSTTF